jgi:hypothetical protein
VEADLQDLLDLYSFMYDRPRVPVHDEQGQINEMNIKTALTSFKKNIAVKKQYSSTSSAYVTSSILKKFILDVITREQLDSVYPEIRDLRDKIKGKWVGPRLWQFFDSFKLPWQVKNDIMLKVIARCDKYAESCPEPHFIETLSKLK